MVTLLGGSTIHEWYFSAFARIASQYDALLHAGMVFYFLFWQHSLQPTIESRRQISLPYFQSVLTRVMSKVPAVEPHDHDCL